MSSALQQVGPHIPHFNQAISNNSRNATGSVLRTTKISAQGQQRHALDLILNEASQAELTRKQMNQTGNFL